MIYLYQTQTGIEPHTDKVFAEETLGLGQPIAELTEEQWDQCGGLARIIDDTVVYGKTVDEEREEKAHEVREKRDWLLSQTDWTQTVDNPLAGNEDITAYRQALRDIPEQVGFPWDVEWPIL